MALKRLVSASTVSDLLQKGIINRDGVRLLDCTYSIGPKLDWKQYKEQLYGKFDMLHNAKTLSRQQYLASHIPQAAHITLDAAMYPSEYYRFTMYPPEMFEKYVQLVGINKGEHIIFYSRGPLNGMMFAAKFAWLFKSYGHDNVSIIDGGFAQWQKQGLAISTDDFRLKPGNWTATDKVADHVITFEELMTKDAQDKEYIDKTDEVNFLDTRIRGQFNGTEDTGLDPYHVSGSNIPGFKNCPSVELVNNKGTLLDKEQIKQWLLENGMKAEAPIVTSCNLGMQASLLAYVIDSIIPASKPRLYNGSLKEMELRAPKKISGGRMHLPH